MLICRSCQLKVSKLGPNAKRAIWNRRFGWNFVNLRGEISVQILPTKAGRLSAENLELPTEKQGSRQLLVISNSNRFCF